VNGVGGSCRARGACVRGWGADEGGEVARGSFFAQVQALLAEGGERRALACRLLLALTDEFSFGKFSGIGASLPPAPHFSPPSPFAWVLAAC
jgi:hypothetical protein